MMQFTSYVYYQINYKHVQGDMNMLKTSKKEYRKRVIFIIGQSKVQYDVYSSWSVNKTKCLLSVQFSKLNFDQFELMHSGRLLNGSTKIGQVPSTSKQLTLIVINVKSNIKLQQYYRKSMQVYLQSCRHDKQPIMQNRYQKIIKNIQAQQKSEEDQGIDGQNRNQRQNLEDLQIRIQVPHIFQVLRWIGLGLFIMMLLIRGAPYQIGIMITIICSHYLIQFYRMRNAKNPVNNNPQHPAQSQKAQQQPKQIKQRNKTLDSIKAQFMLRMYKSIQIIICFILTFYPNWDLTLHYNINQQRLIKWRNKINQLRPGTYPVRNKFL